MHLSASGQRVAQAFRRKSLPALTHFTLSVIKEWRMTSEDSLAKRDDPTFRDLCTQVVEAMERLHVPGVVVGVLQEGREQIAGFGVTSIEHPLPVTADTLFQIGSITKTFTGTLVMRLVEQGKLDLDAPLLRYLPDLRMADE